MCRGGGLQRTASPVSVLLVHTPVALGGVKGFQFGEAAVKSGDADDGRPTASGDMFIL